MDPNATLARIRGLTADVRRYEHIDVDDATALADAINDLDGWIMGGGFLPDAWARRTGVTAPRIEVLHQRDPDASCLVNVYVNGVDSGVAHEVDVDPGAGYTRRDWRESMDELRAEPDLTPAFRQDALGAMEAAEGSEYITEDYA